VSVKSHTLVCGEIVSEETDFISCNRMSSQPQQHEQHLDDLEVISMALMDSVVRMAVEEEDKEDSVPALPAVLPTPPEPQTTSCATDVKDEVDSLSPPSASRSASRSASPYTDEDEDFDVPAHDDQPSREPSYFNELFPRLDLDKGAWLRAWPKFGGSNKGNLLSPPSKYARESAQYEFNLRMYEQDVRTGQFVHKDLRMQDAIQRKYELDSSLYDRKMYTDYYGRIGFNERRWMDRRSAAWNRSVKAAAAAAGPPDNYMDLIEWNVRVKHAAKDDNDLNISLFDRYIPSHGREREKLNVAELRMAADRISNQVRSKKDISQDYSYSTCTLPTMFKPLPPHPMRTHIEQLELNSQPYIWATPTTEPSH